MRRTRFLLIAALLLAAVPTTAGAAVPDYQRVISSRHADAALVQLDGCLVTEVFVSAMDAVFGGRPGPINRQGLAGVLVRQSDVCAGAAAAPAVGLFAAGGGGGVVFDGLGQTLDRLGSTPRFDSAWLDAAIPVVNEVTGEEVTVTLHLSWTLVGQLERDTSHTHVRFPHGAIVNSHTNSLMGSALVGGTVQIGDELLTFAPAEGATLQQVKYGCQVMMHPNGDVDADC